MGDVASVINNGGHMFVGVLSGGVVASAYAPLINEGGALTVYDDGIINITSILKGGSLHAQAGSFITGPLYLRGGTVTIDNNVAVGTENINFSTGHLILNGSPTNGAAYIYNNFLFDMINPTDQRTLSFWDYFDGRQGTTTQSAYSIFNIADGIKIDLAGMKFQPAVTIAKITADKLMVTNNISTFEIPLTGNINGAILVSPGNEGGTLVEVMKSVAIVGAVAPASLDVGHHLV